MKSNPMITRFIYQMFLSYYLKGVIPFLMVMVWGIGHPKDDRFPIAYHDQDYDDDPFAFHFSFVFEIFAFLISGAAFALELFDFWRNE